MDIRYLVTTNIKHIPTDCRIAMVDGTVPLWEASTQDLHFDHHKPNGGLVQIDEMPSMSGQSYLDIISTNEDKWCIVTTQVDADACVAAAWLQLTSKCSEQSLKKLRAIALDCDYLKIPASELPELGQFTLFAEAAVATLKESGKDIIKQLGLDSNRSTWNEEQKSLYASMCFEKGTTWLINAALGKVAWPGEQGEAQSYFERLEKQKNALILLKCIKLWNGYILFDQRSISEYIDPRVPLQIGEELAGDNLRPLTLSFRSMPINLGTEDNRLLIPGYQYTLGTVPSLASGVDLTSVFPVLAEAEKARRGLIGQPPAVTTWGGRAAVGGSGWRDGSLLDPAEVLSIAIDNLNL